MVDTCDSTANEPFAVERKPYLTVKAPQLFGQFPNIKGMFKTYVGDNDTGCGAVREAHGVCTVAEPMNYPVVGGTSTLPSVYSRVNLSASNSSSIFKDGVTTVNVNALYGLHLIRAYEA